MSVCATCGQEIAERRLDVVMSALKARIFDIIKRAGPDGIDNNELFEMTLRDRNVQRATLRVHVFQINDLLFETDYIIKCHPARGKYTAYRLERRRSHVAA